MSSNDAIGRLNSPTQLVVKILEVIHDDRATERSVGEVIRLDPATVARLIVLANSSAYSKAAQCNSIDRAIAILGLDAVKTVVITAARKQFSKTLSDEHTELLKVHWKKSLISGRISLELAVLTHYPSPDAAYISGLLADIGQLALLVQDNDDCFRRPDPTSQPAPALIAEHERCIENSDAVGAGLFANWPINSLVVDAIRHHRDSLGALQGAHQLVQLTKLAGLLVQSKQRPAVTQTIDSEELTHSHDLLGLDEKITRELVGRVSADVEQIALNFGVHTGEGKAQERQLRKVLGERLGMYADISQISNQLSYAQQGSAPRTALRNALLLTGNIPNVLLFLYREKQQVLEAYLSDREARSADFRIPAKSDVSVIGDCFVQQSLKSVSLSEPMKVVDRQVTEHLGTQRLVCVPLTYQHRSIGVLAMGHYGLVFDETLQRSEYLRLLAAEIAQRLETVRLASGQTEGREVNEDGVDLRVLEAVHEVSNPLTIILNSLEMLRVSSVEDYKDGEKIERMKEEVEGIKKILSRLTSPRQKETAAEKLHKVIESLAEVFRVSFLGAKRIDIILTLDEETESVVVDPVLIRQVLTNLLKNSIEALQTKGKILIVTENNINVGGESYFAVYVHDNGPGIPSALRKDLFAPMKSTKGAGHSGLGLSIVKKMLDEIGGTIVCRSNADPRVKATGTQFQILIPTSSR